MRSFTIERFFAPIRKFDPDNRPPLISILSPLTDDIICALIGLPYSRNRDMFLVAQLPPPICILVQKHTLNYFTWYRWSIDPLFFPGYFYKGGMKREGNYYFIERSRRKIYFTYSGVETWIRSGSPCDVDKVPPLSFGHWLWNMWNHLCINFSQFCRNHLRMCSTLSRNTDSGD